MDGGYGKYHHLQCNIQGCLKNNHHFENQDTYQIQIHFYFKINQLCFLYFFTRNS